MKPFLLALPLAFVAACGGGSSNVSAGLSKTAYIAKAEVICAKANADVKALAFPTTPASIVTYVNKLVEIAGKATEDLDALDEPSADKANLTSKVITPLKAQLTEGQAYAAQIDAAVKDDDQKKLGELIGNPPTQTEADTAWMTTYGFKACVESAKTDS